MDERGVGPSHSCRAPPAGPPRVHSRQVPALAATKCSYHITWKPNRLWLQSAIITTSQHSSPCCVLVDPNTTYTPHRGQASPPKISSTAAIAANEKQLCRACLLHEKTKLPHSGARVGQGGGCNACQRPATAATLLSQHMQVPVGNRAWDKDPQSIQPGHCGLVATGGLSAGAGARGVRDAACGPRWPGPRAAT